MTTLRSKNPTRTASEAPPTNESAERIVVAARGHFFAHGFRSVTMDDLAGELGMSTLIRITDQNNGGASGSDPATVNDLPLGATMACAATADANTGGACATSTSLDALVPGTVKEGQRSVWQLGQVMVTDGGSDGLASTTPNSLFARQGVFVP